MEEIDAMLSHLLGEIDHLSQSLTPEVDTGKEEAPPREEGTLSVGFTDLKESLHELEDQDLDALVADLESKSTSAENNGCTDDSPSPPPAPILIQESEVTEVQPSLTEDSPAGLKAREFQTKSKKIKLALEKLKEAKIRKTLMVDERQRVREVLDTLFEKTHCDRSADWSLCETIPELQIERGLEDHEYFVELLSHWTRHSQNKIHFISRTQKYVMFREPQLFFLGKKNPCHVNNQLKEYLIKEHFGKMSLIVPDVEGVLYLKEDGKKVWKPRYFLLRASGLYYVPKGKTKSSTDLACFVRFDKVNIYTTTSYREKYRAPSDFCFVLKHPCIQMESPYIKFLCCEDQHSLLLWVTSIRIAKYGTTLYKSYQEAERRAAAATNTLQPTRHTGQSNSHSPLVRAQTGPVSFGCTNGDDYPPEDPPDFIPPPPPGRA